MYSILLVGIGGALGSIARYVCTLALLRWLGEAFPWGTLFVNVTGSYVIGFFFLLTATGGRLLVSPEWRLFVMAGLCGGFTTFSSFSLQSLVLLREGQWLAASLNIFGSVVLCMASVSLGFFCAAVLSPKP